MMKRYLAIALCGIFTGQVEATVLLDDGALHTIDGFIFDNIQLENESDLNVVGRALVLSGRDSPAISSPRNSEGHEVQLYDRALLFGSVILGGDADERNRVIVNDRARIFGIGTDSYNSASGRAGIGGVGFVEVNGHASVRGSYNSEAGGPAVSVGDSGAFRTSLNGGSVVGGVGGQYGGTGIDGSLEVMEINQTDGVIQGGRGNTLGGDGIDTKNLLHGFIDGGEIVGGYGVEQGGAGISAFDMQIDITNGVFRGGDGGEYGGSAIVASYMFSPSDVRISGGSYNAGRGPTSDGYLLNLWGSMVRFTITGGQFGYETVGNGFTIHGATVEVHGTELTLNDDVLTGYLMDGSWIEVPVNIVGGNLSIVNH